MTFSSHEILEDFCESVVCANRMLIGIQGDISEHLSFDYGFRDPHKAADAFLAADEATREKIRTAPRKVPKDPFPHARESIGFAEAEQIRKIHGTYSTAEIARRLRVHPTTIHRIVTGKHRARKEKATPEIKRAIFEDRFAGMSGPAIAKKHCLSDSYVYHILKGESCGKKCG